MTFSQGFSKQNKIFWLSQKTKTSWQESHDKPRQCVRKQRHHSANKGPQSQGYGHVWLSEVDCKEGRAPKNWCLRTVVLEKTLRVPWTAWRSNRPILREINPEYSLEGLMLKLQYFGHLMQTANSLEKSPMLGKTEGRRRREHQMMRWVDGSTSAIDMNLGKLQEMMRDREVWCVAVHGVTTGRLDNNKPKVKWKNCLL